jgi:hypothetical protein
MLSVSTLYTLKDWMINECEAVGGIKLARETQVLGVNPHSTTLSTINPTQSDLESYPSHSGG